jgi:hypothetical protein
MHTSMKRASRGAIFLALALAVVAPASAFAADGEIGDMGDTDSITDVFVSGGRPAVNVDYLRDCPAAGITDCWIEVQFVSKCPEIWCGWVAGPWRRIPASGAARGDCLGSGNEENQWYVNYRAGFLASAKKTVQWKGEVELALSLSGSYVYRLIAEAMMNVTGGVGFSGGTTIETVTVTSDYSPAVQAASSGGRQIITC